MFGLPSQDTREFSDGTHEAPGETQNGTPSKGNPPPDDPTATLKRESEKCRLPAEMKQQVLAELPSLEEHERLYREAMANGGLTFEDFFESLVEEVKSP